MRARAKLNIGSSSWLRMIRLCKPSIYLSLHIPMFKEYKRPIRFPSPLHQQLNAENLSKEANSRKFAYKCSF